MAQKKYIASNCKSELAKLASEFPFADKYLFSSESPVGAQFSNTVESRIRLTKQYARERINKVKGEKFEPITLTQTDYIMSCAIDTINSIPLIKSKNQPPPLKSTQKSGFKGNAW